MDASFITVMHELKLKRSWFHLIFSELYVNCETGRLKVQGHKTWFLERYPLISSAFLLAQHWHKVQNSFELGSHFVTPTRHTLALPPSMKIMRLFDVRPLWALMRGVYCSGHMKALQSIWTMSSHYGSGPRHRGGPLTSWRGAEFNDGGNGWICHPFNFSWKEAVYKKKNSKVLNTTFGGTMNGP